MAAVFITKLQIAGRKILVEGNGDTAGMEVNTYLLEPTQIEVATIAPIPGANTVLSAGQDVRAKKENLPTQPLLGNRWATEFDLPLPGNYIIFAGPKPGAGDTKITGAIRLFSIRSAMVDPIAR